ncbi:SDR family NAD(P)-dependent oxidoreductase [Nostocaceae cyanobacterium CENA357]|uniref:SDR family NAD(P)-dependent oxidoreductase n=1 Tax=Atlanticothrix silvestris CENA357 TaxID=1725252 RepID=A0A8J7HAC5_9CYAN|nr:SDR family NAD(P)-dependent oxidoreductase [Atlanticothrix silvestris]MBH8551998.1 SDR family NAD(P)-dependent oxidoreductase [Atlanticothrix silvestris CENA357]
MTNLAGKTVLLTGASRGLGVYIARALAIEKATVVCVSRSKAELDITCDEITALGGKSISIPFDLKDVNKLSTLKYLIHQSVGKVDILINNAGIEICQFFTDYSLDEIQSVLEVNLLSPIELTRLFLPNMLKQRSGHIVNIASLGGKKGVAYSSTYSASKAGLIIWSDAMRQELVGTGVEMSVICPGYISPIGSVAKNSSIAPQLAGKSTPTYVANAVIRAIKQNKAEIIVNQELITECFTRLLFAIGQLYSPFVDAIYRWIDIPKFNRMRVEKQRCMDDRMIKSVVDKRG